MGVWGRGPKGRGTPVVAAGRGSGAPRPGGESLVHRVTPLPPATAACAERPQRLCEGCVVVTRGSRLRQRAHVHACTRAHMHAHTCTHTHIHTQSLPCGAHILAQGDGDPRFLQAPCLISASPSTQRAAGTAGLESLPASIGRNFAEPFVEMLAAWLAPRLESDLLSALQEASTNAGLCASFLSPMIF